MATAAIGDSRIALRCADKAGMKHLFCSKDGCPGPGRCVANDENEAARLARKGTLRAHCVVFDSWWTFSGEEQAVIARNLARFDSAAEDLGKGIAERI